MKNVHRTIADSLWIYKGSLSSSLQPSGVGYQTAALFRPTWPGLPDRLLLSFFASKSWFVPCTAGRAELGGPLPPKNFACPPQMKMSGSALTAGHSRCWARSY